MEAKVWRVFCLIAVILTMIACEPGDLFDLPIAPSRITILSLTESGEPWRVQITKTGPVSSSLRGIPNARVQIFDNGNFLQELQRIPLEDETDADYQPTIFVAKMNTPLAGHAYEIIVEADGLPTAKSKYVQPDPVPAEFTFTPRDRKFYLSHNSNSNGAHWTDTVWYSRFDATITITDPPGENFYDFTLSMSAEENEVGLYYRSLYFDQNADGVVPTNQEFVMDGIVDDTKFSGQKHTFNFIVPVTGGGPVNPQPLPNWFKFSIRTMTKENFKYIVQARKGQLALYDPYAQPVTTYTNVQNGLGIFGGFSPTSKVFYYKIAE